MEVLNEIFLLPQNLHQELYLMLCRHGELYLHSKFRKTPAVLFQAERHQGEKQHANSPISHTKKSQVMGGHYIAERASFFLILLKSLQLFLALERLQALEYFLHSSQQCEVLCDGRPGMFLCCCSSTWPKPGCRYLRLSNLSSMCQPHNQYLDSVLSLRLERTRKLLLFLIFCQSLSHLNNF